MRGLIDTAFHKAVSILTTNRPLLDRAATDLLAKETMSGADLLSVAGQLVPGEAVAEGPAIAVARGQA